MPKTIEDLYRRGTEVTLDEGDGNPVVIWLQKLDPVEQDTALGKANAAQAVVLASQFTEDDEWKAVYADALQADTEDIVEQLIVEFTVKRRPVVTHRVAVSEPWANEGYLDGLQRAWDDGLHERPEDDGEAKRVRSELDRFSAEVDEQLNAEIEYRRRELAVESTESLVHQQTLRALKFRALIRWQRSFNDWVLFYAMRDNDDHAKQLLDSLDRVARLDGRVKTDLVKAYTDMVVDVTQGKGSPGHPGSSPSSEPAAPEATSDSSGQKAA